MEKYEKLEKLGEGTYGKVYKARNKETGQLVAIKVSRLETMGSDGVPATTLRECSLLQILSQSPYIVRLLSIESVNHPSGSHFLFLVFEYLHTDLKKFINSRGRGPYGPTHLPPLLIQRFCFQICKGIAHCHSHGVLHRDLKCANILLDQEKVILKIADFGLSRTFTIPIGCYTHKIVTLWYRAPEILLGSSCYSTGVDMWSVGCIFAEMVVTEPLFRGDSEFRQLLSIFRVLGTPTEMRWRGVTSLSNWHAYPKWEPRKLENYVPTLGADGADLLSKMLMYDPAQRISAKEALDHPYFDGLDKSQF